MWDTSQLCATMESASAAYRRNSGAVSVAAIDLGFRV